MFLSIDREEEEVRGSGGSSDEETMSPAMQVHGSVFYFKILCVHVQYLTLGKFNFHSSVPLLQIANFFRLHSLTCSVLVHVVLKCIFMLVW